MEGNVVFSGKTKTGIEIVIRYPKMDDVEEACRYINELSQERTYVLFQGEEITIEREKKYFEDWVEKIKDNKMVQLLVFHNEKLIGIAGVDLFDRVEKHVGSLGISIAKDYRNQGVGKILFTTLLDEARRHIKGLKIIVLGVFSNNDLAIEIYKKHGFIEHGRLPGGVLHKEEYVDHIHMHKIME